MNLRITLFALAAVLLAGHASHAGTPLTSPAIPGGLPFCVADLAAPALPSFAPSALPMSFSIPPCGACSLSNCIGFKPGQICGIGGGGQYKFCADIGTCPQDGRIQCSCQTGPPF